MAEEAWVTLATTDSYALGALVLGHSLRQVCTTKHLVVMVTPSVSSSLREQLQKTFDLVSTVDVLDSNDSANLALIKRPDLGVTFTKLHCWHLTQYKKCVFLDADTLLLQNSDELFEREELSAAPDIGWPDCFNSGVFVYQPSLATYQALLDFAVSQGSFDGGDQGLLNLYFNDWSQRETRFRLPFIYNMTSNISYIYPAALKQFGKNVKIVHFIGNIKPWHHGYNVTSGTLYFRGDSNQTREHIEAWWSLFSRLVYPALQTSQTDDFESISQPTSSSDQHAVFDRECEFKTETNNFVVDLPWGSYWLELSVVESSVTRDVVPSMAVINPVSQVPFYVPVAAPDVPVATSSNVAISAASTSESSFVDVVQLDTESAATKQGDAVETDVASAFKELQLMEGAKGDERAHQARWETGQIDYKGEDSFSNIQSWLDKSLEQPK